MEKTVFQVRRAGYRTSVRPIMRALVTGGAGFLGTHLCEQLLDGGAEVVSVDDLSTSPPAGAAHLAGRPGYRFVRHDICHPGVLEKTGTAFDTVFHLASPAAPTDYQRRPLATLRAGSAGTEVALQIAERAGARFALASTSEVYGDPGQHPQSENYWGNVNPVGPRSMYDEAKRYAEALTVTHRRLGLADTGIARIFNTYGPGMRGEDGRMVPTFCRQALRGEPLTVSGTGLQTRSLCYVDDTVAGLIALARSDFDGPVNVGNPTELTVLAVAELVRDLAGSGSPIQLTAPAADDPQRRCPDITLARHRLGWEPTVDHHTGLGATLDWFRMTSELPRPGRIPTGERLAR